MIECLFKDYDVHLNIHSQKFIHPGPPFPLISFPLCLYTSLFVEAVWY